GAVGSRARGLSCPPTRARIPAARDPRRRAGDRRPPRGGATQRPMAPAPERHRFGRDARGGRAMTALHIRGACPRLAEPMRTGDGLLARIVTAGQIPIDALAGLCAAAEGYGNGVMGISAPGGPQVRGPTSL